MFLNTTYSQVLYDENFDTFTLGNLGTDPTGVIPGQDGWFTQGLTTISKDNTLFTITAEPGRGKVLTLSSPNPMPQKTISLHATKTGLNSLIDQRTAGENVIKLEIDYYTGAQHIRDSYGINTIMLLCDCDPTTGAVDDILVRWSFDYYGGAVSFVYHNGIVFTYTGVNNLPSTLPFNTWVTFIAYLDYPNKKVYFETPYLGKVAVGDFLSQSTSTNLIMDFKPSVLLFSINTYDITSTNQMVNKYDNIKITALNAVPPEVIALSVDDVLSEKFNLYPNPATDVVNITNSENMFVNQVAVYDVTGKQLNTQTFNNESEIQLNVENLASGVYMLHLQTNEGTAIKKLVKK